MTAEIAIVYCACTDDLAPSAIQDAFAAVGYAAADGSADLTIHVDTSAAGVAFSLVRTTAFALALGRRLARSLRKPVRVLTARLVDVADEKGFELDLDEWRIAASGETRPGDWPERLEAEVDGDFRQLCDGKAHFALDAVTERAFAELLGPEDEIATTATLRLQLPRSLGFARLDALAERIRLADRAVVGSVDGRACIRVTTESVTTTTFVDASETAILEQHLGSLARQSP